MSENIILPTVIISTLIIIMLVAVVAVVIYLAKKQGEIQALKMKQLALDFEKELRKSELEASESVMKHIARELHDNIAMIFTTANFGLNDFIVGHPEVKDTIDPVRKTLANGIEQLRLYSRSMNQDFIFKKTLSEMIAIEVERLGEIGKIQVHNIDYQSPLQISKEQELIVFRIFQELIQNILKHAHAKNIFINLSSADGFQLTVSDDGIGFDAKNIKNKNGITNITERAKLANLNCEYFTAPSKGCKVTIQKNID